MHAAVPHSVRAGSRGPARLGVIVDPLEQGRERMVDGALACQSLATTTVGKGPGEPIGTTVGRGRYQTITE